MNLFNKGLTVLTKKEMDKIHLGALEILQEVGMKIDHERILKILEGFGLKVDHHSKIVKFSGRIIEKMLEEVRAKSIQDKTNASKTLQCAMKVGGHLPFICDMDTNAIRGATRKDLENATIIGNALAGGGFVGPLFYPQDVPQQLADIHLYDVMLRKAANPGFASPRNKGAGKYLKEMLAVVYPGEKTGEKLFSCVFITTPLCFNRDDLELGLEILDLGGTVHFAGHMAVAGASAPATLAGTLVLSTAEGLAGCIIHQALGIEPILGYADITMDYKTMAPCYSGPDRMLLELAGRELADYYGFPCGETGLSETDAVTPGLQAGIEKTYGAMLSLAQGLNVVIKGGAVGPGGLTGSLPQICIDEELSQIINRLIAGIKVDHDTLAVDLIKKNGIGGSFLAEEHTARHFRRETWSPLIFQRVAPDVWSQNKKDAYGEAVAKVREILSAVQPAILNAAQEKELDRIVAKAKADLD